MANKSQRLTVAQYHKKIQIAREQGSAYLGDGCTLYFFGFWEGFSIRRADGGTILATHNPERYADVFAD